jgi:hypothetical protein
MIIDTTKTKEAKIIYDVDIFLTKESPDEDVLSGLCETYRIFDKIAHECEGAWDDWEPNRCTFSFDTKEASNRFVSRIRSEGYLDARKVNFEQKEWLMDW